MSRLIEYDTGHGATVLFEVSDDDIPEEILVGKQPHEVAKKATRDLDQALDGVKSTLEAVIDKLKALAPSELEIELGIKATAEAGIVVTKYGGEANIKVTAAWKSS